jgi:hypothetical protein
MEKHTLAIISIVGSSLDVLSALYLAYDLLGGQHGPLRTLTRGVTYGVIFGIGYGLALGPIFGIASGAAHGITLAWEFSIASKNLEDRNAWRDAIASMIRGAGFGIGTAYLYGKEFGLAFGAISALSQIIAYRIGILPTIGYGPAVRPRLTWKQLLTSVNRAVGYTVAGYLSALVSQQRDRGWVIGIKAGLSIGIVTAIGIGFAPFVEWAADRVPERVMGVAGIGLILIGFAMQSTQYWVALLDIPLR